MISPCVFRKRESNKYLAFIEITNSCNMKCKHCMNWSVKDANIGFEREKILRLIKELHEIETEEIYISGGEPLLYPYIDEVILYANSLGIKVTLATNALEITNHLEVIKKGVQLVSISLDGIGETHDNFRGVKGAFDNCVNIFKLLKENNVKTRISAMIWKENYEELEEMIALAKSCGVSKVNLAFLIPTGRAKSDETIKLPIEKYKETVEIVANLREKYKSNDFEFIHDDRYFKISRVKYTIDGNKFNIITTNKYKYPLEMDLSNIALKQLEDIGKQYFNKVLPGWDLKDMNGMQFWIHFINIHYLLL